MIEITGILIFNLQCDKCGKSEMRKTELDETDNQFLSIALPDGWFRKHYRKTWQIWCAACIGLYGRKEK